MRLERAINVIEIGTSIANKQKNTTDVFNSQEKSLIFGILMAHQRIRFLGKKKLFAIQNCYTITAIINSNRLIDDLT